MPFIIIIIIIIIIILNNVTFSPTYITNVIKKEWKTKSKSGSGAAGLCLWALAIQGTLLTYVLTPWSQGRIKLFGAPRQWKHFRPLF